MSTNADSSCCVSFSVSGEPAEPATVPRTALVVPPAGEPALAFVCLGMFGADAPMLAPALPDTGGFYGTGTGELVQPVQQRRRFFI
ncbi:MAG: hypothetical protein LLF75_11915 [Eubacteriales bacterium]|nr:hypothetical protein [Eubacteriales bacterium]